MSRTWKDGRAQRYWRAYWDNYQEDHGTFLGYVTDRSQHPQWVWSNYSRNPNWWNHLHTITPNRRKTHALERNCSKMTVSDTEGLLWPLNNRPSPYYW